MTRCEFYKIDGGILFTVYLPSLPHTHDRINFEGKRVIIDSVELKRIPREPLERDGIWAVVYCYELKGTTETVSPEALKAWDR